MLRRKYSSNLVIFLERGDWAKALGGMARRNVFLSNFALMSTILFNKAVFGPIHSRRLGVSLGINLLPTDGKVCSFDCLYCECGFNRRGDGVPKLSPLPTRGEVAEQLENALVKMVQDGECPDVITYAGNGEPTLHPHFAEIVGDTVALRDKYAPKAKVCVLTNATRLGDAKVVEGLCLTDEAILKIDSGLESTVKMLDRPTGAYSLDTVVERIAALRKRLGDALTIQTMFVTWTDEDGVEHDNSREEDVKPWLEILRRLSPPRLMIYTIDRETPLKTMAKTAPAVLDAIAARAREIVPEVSVSY